MTGGAECGFLFGELPDRAPVDGAEAAFTFGGLGTIVGSAVRTSQPGEAEVAVDAAHVDAQACETFSSDDVREEAG